MHKCAGSSLMGASQEGPSLPVLPLLCRGRHLVRDGHSQDIGRFRLGVLAFHGRATLFSAAPAFGAFWREAWSGPAPGS